MIAKYFSTFNVNNFVGTYVFELFKIFGLATMSLTMYSKKKNTKLKTLFVYSYHGTMYNIIFIILLIVAGVYKIYHCITKLEDESKMNLAIDFFSNFIVYAVSVVVLFKYVIGQSLAIKIGNALFTGDAIMKKFDNRYKETSIVAHQTFVLLFDGAIWITIVVVGLFVDITPEDTILTDIPNFIINCLVMQYVLVIIFIYGMMKTINDQFNKYVCYASSKILLRKIQRIYTLEIFTVEMEKITTLRELCLNLYDISNDVSNFYSIPILICITKLFFSILLNAYFFIKPSIIGKNIITSVSDVWSLCWLSLDTFSLLVLTQSITTMINEVFIDIFFFLLQTKLLTIKILG